MNIVTGSIAWLVWITTISAIAAGTDPAPANATGPKIQFATNTYNYGRQSSGTAIKYTFIFTNLGDQVLEVPTAQGSCHCTTAGDWSKRVEPGKTGVIPVTFDSTGFSGPMTRTVTVSCNDKTQPTVVLQLAGTLWKPIEVNPAMAYFNVPPDSSAPASTVVHIVSNLPEPLTVFPPESNQPAFTAVLKTNEAGKHFELTITAVPPFSSGTIQGQIKLKTSSSNTPLLSVSAMAHVQPAITVSPPRITLPGPPLAAEVTNTLTIQNVGTNFLKLTEAAVNAKGVEVQVHEAQPGHLFIVSLIFLRGFEAPAGAPVEFSVKSSHPQYPVIKAPVTWVPRPPKPASTGAH
jgi:hypothetical protein